MEGYNCHYQDKHSNKTKGTGVALYIKDELNAVVNDELSWITKNLETLFVTIQHDEPLHIGVVYRPPSGKYSEAINEFKKIVEMCPKKNVYLLGDFNVNLHDENNTLVQEFEDITLGLGLSPLISTYTHEKPGCNQTCIDNILTNDIENTIHSGTLSTCITHHLAVFNIFSSPVFSNESHKQKYTQYYDYCNKNVDNFVQALATELYYEPPDDFNEFLSVFNHQLDKACKLEKPKCSKRTAKNNPWITPALVVSINRKHELYGIWKKAKKSKCLHSMNPKQTNCPCCNCKNVTVRYEEFKAHRKLLNYLINCAKRSYNGDKIKECVGDSKKNLGDN